MDRLGAGEHLRGLGVRHGTAGRAVELAQRLAAGLGEEVRRGVDDVLEGGRRLLAGLDEVARFT